METYGNARERMGTHAKAPHSENAVLNAVSVDATLLTTAMWNVEYGANPWMTA